MKRRWLWMACALLWLAPTLALAQAQLPDTPLVFRDNTEETRFHDLTRTLRCVMCQNESLADSQAMIARDLRRQILDLMRQGRSDAQIRQFLVARYGQFVLYQPRMEPTTWLLWFGPPLLLLVGGIGVFALVRKRAVQSPDVSADDDSGQEW